MAGLIRLSQGREKGKISVHHSSIEICRENINIQEQGAGIWDLTEVPQDSILKKQSCGLFVYRRVSQSITAAHGMASGVCHHDPPWGDVVRWSGIETRILRPGSSTSIRGLVVRSLLVQGSGGLNLKEKKIPNIYNVVPPTRLRPVDAWSFECTVSHSTLPDTKTTNDGHPHHYDHLEYLSLRDTSCIILA